MFRWEDMLVIFAVALLLFGPNKLKDWAQALGGSLHEFKKAANPEGQTAPAQPAAAQPVYLQAAKAPIRRARKPAAAKKKVKAAR